MKFKTLLLSFIWLLLLTACSEKGTFGNFHDIPASTQNEENTEQRNTEENKNEPTDAAESKDEPTDTEESKNEPTDTEESKNEPTDAAESKDEFNESSEEADTAKDNDVSSELVDGMRPEFKEAMDSYEAFYDEYCSFIKKYNENPSDMQLLNEYFNMLEKSIEMDEKFDAWTSNEMNDAELAYYLKVQNRIMQKLLAVSGAE